MKEFNLVVCGGTFEYLHEGHKAFLHSVLEKGRKILIGLTSDFYVKQHKKNTKQSYQERKKLLEKFLRDQKEKITIVPIDSLYIPKQWEKLPIEAIIVTKDSFSGAKAINKQREKEGLPLLEIVESPLVLEKSRKPISSSQIRKNLFSQQLLLPEDVRKQLQKPFGLLIRNFESWMADGGKDLEADKIVTVGDVITKACNKLGLGQKISVIDFLVERQKIFSDIRELGFEKYETMFTIANPPGTLTPELFARVRDIFLHKKSSGRIIVLIRGEEDLSVLPFLLFAPVGFTIFYGQPKEGVVKVDVSKQSKKYAREYIEKFTSK